MQKSTIEWTDATWNPVLGCTPVSDGCRNCYAATIAHRFGKSGPMMGLADWRGGRAVFNGTLSLREDRLEDPLHWKKPRRVFVNSMSDLFHESVPFEFVDKCMEVMLDCDRHTFQVLTKRPERMAEYWHQFIMGIRPVASAGTGANIWLGTSAENQKAANERIPHLLECAAAVRFLSCEPLLGEVNIQVNESLAAMLERNRAVGVDWVIAGCESGKQARPTERDWLRALRNQCAQSNVPFFLKQMVIDGKVVSLPELDGVRHTAMPA